MAAHFLEWLSIAVRWLHVVAAIAWVGASFYFIWVENALSRGGKQRTPQLAGHLWSVHGGGFYYLEKYRGAPDELPPKLHWFKWEAYATWLSGMALLVLVYHLNASAWLVAADGPLPASGAIMASIALIVGGWLGYDVLCRTPLLRYPLWMAAVGLASGTALIYALTDILTSRAIFLHLGAMMGTAMAGNVLFVIIPSQKQLVAAAKSGQAVDLALGRRAAQRSLHNNYLSLPAVFLMISIHYPGVYNHPHSALLFALITVAGGFVRHFFNCKNRGTAKWRWLLPAFIAFAAAAVLSLPANKPDAATTTLADIRPLIEKHCVSCHSATPSDSIFRVAPAGLLLDTDAQIRAAAESSRQRVFVDRSMPFNNPTGMTEAERRQFANWSPLQKGE